MLMVDINSWLNIRLTPAAIAVDASPVCRLWHAKCSATRLPEQAVSIVILGPFKSKKYDNLFAAIARDWPAFVH